MRCQSLPAGTTDRAALIQQAFPTNPAPSGLSHHATYAQKAAMPCVQTTLISCNGVHRHAQVQCSVPGTPRATWQGPTLRSWRPRPTRSTGTAPSLPRQLPSPRHRLSRGSGAGRRTRTAGPVKRRRSDEPEEPAQMRVTRAAIRAEEEAQDTMDVLSALAGTLLTGCLVCELV